MGKKFKINPAKCELCGDIREEYVVLLVNPDPVKHEVWCDDCYVKTIKEQQNDSL